MQNRPHTIGSVLTRVAWTAAVAVYGCSQVGSAGSGQGAKEEFTCAVAADCADAFGVVPACRTIACDEGVCQLAAMPDGTECAAPSCEASDANLSHRPAGVCAGALCKQPATVACAADPCQKPTCDDLAGCGQAAEDGAACDADANPCTVGDGCVGGTCKPGKAPDCDDANPCTEDACDAKTGACGHEPLANGSDCDDGDLCTVDGTCAAGACKGAVSDCDDDDPCTQDNCVAEGCSHDPQEGAPCDDGDVCTGADACAGGSCAGLVISCTDDNPCTTDSCDSSAGCQYLDNQLACDDGNPCTVADMCAAGICQSGDGECPCKADAECADKDDGDLCNGTLYCDLATGTCAPKPGSEVACAGVGPCQTSTCVAKTGLCQNVPVADGKPCDAGDACLQSTQCKAGKCQGDALDCADETPCTADSCDPKAGCQHAPLQALCDDGSACTTADKCDAGKCVGQETSCDDNNACTKDACDAKSGCSHDNVAASCDDGDKCSAIDVCQGGKCTGAKALVCDDGDPCTTDACDAKSGCVADDGNTAGKSCDDGDPCTSAESCQGGKCGNGLVDKCEDGNNCTKDACDKLKGCVHTVIAGCVSCAGQPTCPGTPAANWKLEDVNPSSKTAKQKVGIADFKGSAVALISVHDY